MPEKKKVYAVSHVGMYPETLEELEAIMRYRRAEGESRHDSCQLAVVADLIHKEYARITG